MNNYIIKYLPPKYKELYNKYVEKGTEYNIRFMVVMFIIYSLILILFIFLIFICYKFYYGFDIYFLISLFISFLFS